MAIAVGSIIQGKVTGITHFGAFVELEGGQTGLVHISEVADSYVRDVKDFVKENDIVKVKVISTENGKIGLSIRQAIRDEQDDQGYAANRRQPNRQPARNTASFEEKIAKFLKESEDRLSDLRRNVESKRGGRGGGYSRSGF